MIFSFLFWLLNNFQYQSCAGRGAIVEVDSWSDSMTTPILNMVDWTDSDLSIYLKIFQLPVAAMQRN
jgi:hypothetical protein